MNPHYECNGITIWHGDWRDIRPPDADLVLTDPPYGAKEKTNRGEKGRHHERSSISARDWPAVEGDDEPFDPAPVLALQRPSILWGAQYYADKLPPSRSWLVWDKRDGGASDDNADCELAWTNLDIPARLFRHLWRGMVTASEKQRKVHPTQKPVALMRWCLLRAKLKPGALVFDPYMGSGPIAAACKQLGYRYVGCELVEQYCAAAVDRLSQEVMELR